MLRIRNLGGRYAAICISTTLAINQSCTVSSADAAGEFSAKVVVELSEASPENRISARVLVTNTGAHTFCVPASLQSQLNLFRAQDNATLMRSEPDIEYPTGQVEPLFERNVLQPSQSVSATLSVNIGSFDFLQRPDGTYAGSIDEVNSIYAKADVMLFDCQLKKLTQIQNSNSTVWSESLPTGVIKTQ